MDTETIEPTELVKLEANEGVHGVSSPANGMTFVMIKATDDSDDDDDDDSDDSGSDDDSGDDKPPWAKGLCECGCGEDAPELGKAKMSGKKRNDLPDSAFGYIEPGGSKDADGKTTPRSLRHFPLNDEAHVRNALSRTGSPFYKKAESKIKSAAKKFGIEVKKEGYLTMDGAGPEAEGASPAGGGEADAIGGAAWEQADYEQLDCAAQLIAQAISALGWSRNREAIEGMFADPADIDSALALDDAICSLSCALSTVAGIAYREAVEASTATKSISNWEKIESELNQAVEAVNKLRPSDTGNQSTGAVSGTDLGKESFDVEIAQEQLDELVAKAASDAVAKAEADRKARKEAKTAKAAQEAEDKAKADAEAAAKESAGYEGIPAELAEVISKSVVAGVEAAMTGIEERLEKAGLASAPSTTPAGGPILARPGDSGGGTDSGVAKFEAMRARIQRAESEAAAAAPDSAAHMAKSREAEELRKQLGQDLLREVFAQRGYDDSPNRNMSYNPTNRS